jgi:hypothetical protein
LLTPGPKHEGQARQELIDILALLVIRQHRRAPRKQPAATARDEAPPTEIATLAASHPATR